MTNGEKMLNTFHGKVARCDETVFFTTGGWHHAYDAEWWNAEYKEPTKNDSEIDIAIKIIKADDLAPYSVEDILKARDLAVEALKQMGTTKNSLSVEEITAITEWTAKLTKECEEAYNKGYEAGRKELEPITSKDKFIYALTACGCLLKDGKTWYEHNELIKCFEDLGLFEQETKNCSDCEIVQACVEAGVRSTSRALDILDKIRAELVRLTRNRIMSVDCKVGLKAAINILDEYKAESERT